MNKLSTLFTDMRQNCWRSLLTAVLLVIMGISAMAQGYTGPAITMYYPGANDESPALLKPSTSAYIYFENGALVIYNKARIVQDGVVLGTCVYQGSATGKNTTVMDPKVEDNSDLSKIGAGVFSLEIYEIKYIADGQEVLYSDVDNPIATVKYKRNPQNGKVVSETGIADNTVHSYYAIDNLDGLKTYTFDKAVVNNNVYAELQYGQGDTYIYTKLPTTLSDDGMSVSVDFRGRSLSSDVLAPGVTFYDDNGDPCPPPTTITLIVNNLTCADGSNIGYTAESLDGLHTYEVEGQIYHTYNYLDSKLPTPVLAKAQFYANSNPSKKFAAITDETDMMELTVKDAGVIESADVVFTVSDVTATVPYAEITVNGELFDMAIPAEIKAVGSNGLVISMENVVFVSEDGAQHNILPLNLSSTIKEYNTISEIKALNEGTELILVTDGIKVTLSNDQGYTFVEDETGGLNITTDDYSKVLDQGTLVSGKIAGKYLGHGMLIINPAASSYQQEPIDVSLGSEIESLVEIQHGFFDNCLVTIKASDEISIKYDEDLETIIVGETYPVITDFVADFEAPEIIDQLTAIVFNSPDLGQVYLLIRDNNDVVAGEPEPLIPEPTIVEVSTIAELIALEPETEVILNTDGLTVTLANELGYNFAEDATAGFSIVNAEYTQAVTEGVTIVGALAGVYMGNETLMIDPEKSEYTETPADVTKGAIVEDLDDIFTGKYDNRLVTIAATDDMPIIYDPDMECALIADMLPVMVSFIDDFEAPEVIASVTGIIYKNPYLNDQMYMLARHQSDFEAGEPVVPALTEIATIAEIATLAADQEFILNITDGLVTYSDGVSSYVEDATGAMEIDTDDNSILLTQGTSVTGRIHATVISNKWIKAITEDCQLESADADVTTGKVITKGSELVDPDNAYRLVTIYNTDETPIFVQSNILMTTFASDNIYCLGYDVFGVLADFEFPSEVESFTGILMDAETTGYGERTKEVALRSAEDIVAKTSSISSVTANGSTSDIYNLQGMRIRQAGQGTQGLGSGIYIVDGKKVYIK